MGGNIYKASDVLTTRSDNRKSGAQMSLDDEALSLVADLIQLGLKEYEAKVLIALVKSGRATSASKLAKISQVPRNKIYQILDSLIKLEIVEISEIIGSANLYNLLYEPDNLTKILKEQLTKPIERAAERIEYQLNQISSSIIEEEGEEELSHQIQIIKGKQHIFRLLKNNLEGATHRIFSNMIPAFILPIKDELQKAKQRGVNVSLVLTDEELVKLSQEISLDSISHSVVGASVNKLRNISKYPIFDIMPVDLDGLLNPFEEFLRNRPNLIFIDSEKENGILFLILKSEDPASQILGVQASNKELVNSFAYLESVIMTLASTLQIMQQNLSKESI